MAKFCANCGTQCEDDANVCGACGVPFEGANVANPTFDVPVTPAAKSTKKVGMIVAAVAVVAVVAIAAVLLFSGGGYKSVAKKYMKGFQKMDAEILVGVCSEYLLDQADDMDTDLEDELQDALDIFDDSAKDMYGKDYKISYKIKDAETFKGDDMEDEMEDIGISDPDDVIEDYDITALALVEVELTVEGKKDDKNSDVELYIAKEGGKWKLFYGGL